MNQSEVKNLATQADAMREFIAKLSAARQARVSVVCGVIIEAGDPVNTLNLIFRGEQAHALALQLRQGR